MRYLLISLLSFFLIPKSFSQPKIAVYTPATENTRIYLTLDEAYNNALFGDHIYLPGGHFSISMPISKPIHIYGAGTEIDSSSATGITQIDSITILPGANTGSIEGVVFTLVSTTSPSIRIDLSNDAAGLSNFKISYCLLWHGILINSNLPNSKCTNINISNNTLGTILNSSSIDGALVNSIISNNKILGNTTIGSGNTFTNNLFFSVNLVTSSNSIYQNNIFRENSGPSGENSQYFNNMNMFINGSNGNTGTGNINEQWSTIFENPDFSNYHIKSNSTAHNSGTDGTDRGLYGWATPWKDGSIPSNPHVSNKKVDSKSDSTGILKASFKVTPQSY